MAAKYSHWRWTGNPPPPKAKGERRGTVIPSEMPVLARAINWLHVDSGIRDARTIESCATILSVLVALYEDDDTAPGGARFISATHDTIAKFARMDKSTVKRNMPLIAAPVTAEGDDRPIVILAEGRRGHGTCYMFRDLWEAHRYYRPLECEMIVEGYPNATVGVQKASTEVQNSRIGGQNTKIGGQTHTSGNDPLAAETSHDCPGDLPSPIPSHLVPNGNEGSEEDCLRTQSRAGGPMSLRDLLDSSVRTDWESMSDEEGNAEGFRQVHEVLARARR